MIVVDRHTLLLKIDCAWSQRKDQEGGLVEGMQPMSSRCDTQAPMAKQ